MTQQRRMQAMLAALALIVLAIAGPLWRDFSNDHRRSRVQLARAETILVQTRQLQERVIADRAAGHALEKLVKDRGANFDLYSWINSCIKKQDAGKYTKLTSKGVSSRGRRMQIVDLEIKDIRQKKLLDLIHNVYHGRRLVVLQRLHHLRPARSGTGIDCKLTFTSPSS